MRTLPLIAVLASLAFGLALGLWLGPSLSSEFRIAAHSAVWPTAHGTVIESRNVYLRRTMHLAIVTFAYEVSGGQYTSSQVLCECLGWRAADDALHKFPKGSHTPVFYDPTSPSLAVVRPRDFDAEFLAKWCLEIAAIVLFVAVLPLGVWVLGCRSSGLPPISRTIA